MTVSDNLRDSAARHTVYMTRYSRSVYRRQLDLIDTAIADLSNKIASRGPADNSFTKARLEMMLAEIEKVSKELYSALSSNVADELKQLAAYEAKIQLDMLQDAYPIEMNFAAVTPAQIHAAAMSQPFRGKILRDWWKDQAYGVQSAYQSAVRLGFAESETIPQIVRRVRGVGEMNKQQAEAVIRTAVNHMSQVSRDKLVEANEDIFKGEEYVAVLDGRTTAGCRGFDGQLFDIGKGPRPPLHMGCRSSRIPVTKSWKELGLDGLGDDERLDTRPFVADKRRVKDIPKGDRDDIIGQTTAKSYNDWLKTQKRSFVEDVLGKEKAKLYLDGDLTLDRFIDRRGREFTLEELYDRERQAFNRSGATV